MVWIHQAENKAGQLLSQKHEAESPEFYLGLIQNVAYTPASAGFLWNALQISIFSTNQTSR
jgi:hypothetical protein